MEDESSEEQQPSHFAERPLECSECRKPVSVRYTEVVGSRVTHTIMCADCPQLQRRLHGIPATPEHEETKGEGLGISCGDCGTTLEAIRMGSPMGCSNCYDVFGDVLLSELRRAKRVSRHVATAKASSPVHIGRATGESKEVSPSLRLLALNEALTETLNREDYEQAAWLRDQIKEIEGKKDGKK